ncbi:hypothetical protein [Nostoc punctiforme]|uniref:hypothetical protein n=1 Tax=Nostoc punctiforme TaxID=272131 RepID=UPI000045BC56|nr:hypothetical protein [Nostoc punctiforme]
MNCVSTIQDRNLKYQIVSVYTLLRDVRIATDNALLESRLSLIHPSAALDLLSSKSWRKARKAAPSARSGSKSLLLAIVKLPGSSSSGNFAASSLNSRTYAHSTNSWRSWRLGGSIN